MAAVVRRAAAILQLRERTASAVLKNGQIQLMRGWRVRTAATLPATNMLNGPVGEKMAIWMKMYEDFVGLTDVKVAQNRVLMAEQKFLETQEHRRERQLQIQQIQIKLKEIQVELDKTFRGDDRYLQLVTQEHSIIKDERQLNEEFQFYEKSEREYFSALSNALRDSHERERAYAEKTKYWSIIGSVCGAIIGILGTSINNWVRLRELRDLVKESAQTTSALSVPNLQELVNEVNVALKSQQNSQISLVNDVRALLGSDIPSSKLSKEIVDSVRHLNSSVNKDLSEMKSLLTARQLATNLPGKTDEHYSGAVVYVGHDVEQLVKDAQNNLEWKIKVNSLATVAMIYAAFAVSVPVLYKIFGGGA